MINSTSPYDSSRVTPDWAFIGSPFFNSGGSGGGFSGMGFPFGMRRLAEDAAVQAEENGEDHDSGDEYEIPISPGSGFDPEMVVPTYGYGMSWASKESKIIDYVQGLDLPWQCHDLCFMHQDCNAWTYEYISYLSNEKFPDCILFETVTWAEGYPDLRSIQGDITGQQSFAVKAKEGDCTMEYCLELSNRLPLYMGPWAQYRPDSYCLPHDARCLPVPVNWEEAPLSCCSVCGVMGSAPCDHCPLYDRLKEGSVVVDAISSFFMEWYMRWSAGNDLPFEMRASQINTWGCWSERYIFEDTVSINRMFVDSREHCMDYCMTTESCVAWKWWAAARVSVLQKCELYSSVGSMEPFVNKDEDLAIVVGLEECLLPFERGVGWVLMFFTEALSDENYLKSLQNKDGGGSPSWMSFEELLEIRATLNNFTSRHENIVKVPLKPFKDWSIYTGFDGTDGVFANEGEEYFIVDFSEASETLKWSQGETEERLGLGKYEPMGVQVQCGRVDMLPDEGCLVICIKGPAGEYYGAVKAVVSYLYDIYGQEVKGPGIPELLLLDGVCASMVQGDSQPFWTTTTTTTTMGSCISYGHVGITEKEPLEYVPAFDVDTCIAACEDKEECTFFNFTDGGCQLSQVPSEEYSRVLDFYKADAELCEGDCNSDSECHDSTWLEPSCVLFDHPMTDIISTGKINITATGPSDNCDHQLNTFSFVHRMAQRAPNYVKWVDLEDTGVGLNLMTVDDFITEPVMGNEGCPAEYMNIDGRCFSFWTQRVLRRDAERHCSDIGGHVLSGFTEGLTDQLCLSGMVNCYSYGRDSQYWVGMSPGKAFKMTTMAHEEVRQESDTARTWGMDEDESDSKMLLEMIHNDDGHLNNCLTVDFVDRKLRSAPCAAFCITPPTSLTEWFNSPECRHADQDGRIAVKRLPYICEANDKVMNGDGDINLEIEGLETVEAVMALNSGVNPRKASYEDDMNIERCARISADIVGNDMFNTKEWTNPINTWRECEGLCRAFVGCEGFTYMPPTCALMKEERDKGWPSTVATTVLAHHNTMDGDELCTIRCLNDKECNDGGVYIKGVCYLKTSIETMADENSWLPSISGPVDCDETNDVNISEECPMGYHLYTLNDESICVAVHLARLTAPEAHRVCVQTGGVLASPKTENENLALLEAFCETDGNSCLVPRGVGALDGVYYFGLGATKPMWNDTWHWVDGTSLDYDQKFAGGVNPHLVYNGWPTIQPDNTSGNQLCSYFYPRDSPSGNRNGGWGDEDCDTKCLEPPSFNLLMSHAPMCNDGAGRVTTLGRRFVCTASPTAKGQRWGAPTTY